jgi:hypothetical protein
MSGTTDLWLPALADGKRVKAKLKLTFTPTGGSAAVQAVKVKLKS